MKFVLAAVVAALGTSGAAHADVFLLNYESPGIQHTTADFTTVGVETFDNRTSGDSFTTDFGTNGAISATYSPVQIIDADRYGGAGGTGKYPVVFDSPFSLKFTANAAIFPHGVNYFGFWLSALDSGNQVAFYKNDVKVGALTPSDVVAQVGTKRSYYGNPNGRFHGQNAGEPYAFINFYDTTGSFDEVRFAEEPRRGGYESDNHTVGFYTSVGGAPEPAAWALLLIGFALTGTGMRRRPVTFPAI